MFNCLFSMTTRVSRYEKSKTNLDFTEARDSEWQWHQLGHVQVCNSIQTDNHASPQPLSFFTFLLPFLLPNQQHQSTEGKSTGADCDTNHQLLIVTMKVRLVKRQHSIPPLNLEKLKEEKAVQFTAKVTNRFTTLEAAQNEVTPEDLWKGTKTALLEVARKTIGSVKSQKKKKWISEETFAAIREKREAKGKDKNRYQELKYGESSEWINSSSCKACAWN